MKKNQIKWGAILSYIQMGLSVLVGLIYTPIMIRLLGHSEYGLYNTVSSIISMLSILSLGFNSSYIRYYSIYKEHNDEDSIYKLNGLFLIIFLLIGSVALCCGGFLSFHLELVFDNGLTPLELKVAQLLMMLLTVNLAASFPMSVFSNIISAHECFIFLKLISMINTVISPLITLPLLLVGYRSIAMVAVSVSLSFISYLIYIYYVLIKLKNHFIFHGFEKGIFNSLFMYTIFIAINIIIDQINWNIDKVLLGRFNGTLSVAIYSVGYSLYSYYMSFSVAVSNVFTPRIHKIVNSTKENLQKQREQLSDLFIKVGRIQFLILALIASGVIFFGKYFIVNVWAGYEYRNSYYVAMLLIIPASIALIQNLGIEIQRAQNKHQFRSIVYGGMAIVNLTMSIYLCQIYGAIGSAIGTAIALVLANGIIMNIFYHKQCNINIILFWKNIIHMSKGLIMPIVLGVYINIACDLNKRIVLFGCIILYSTVYIISMWILGMNSTEKVLILKPLKNIVRRKTGNRDLSNI